MNKIVLKISSYLFIPIVWYLVSDVLGLMEVYLLPNFASVLERLSEILQTSDFYFDFFSSFYRWILGYGLGVLFGICFGLIIGLSNSVKSFFDFPLEFLRSMPVTAIFPLFLIIFGIGDQSKIAMAFMPTFLLMLVNTSYGVTLSDQVRRKMAKVFGANERQIFFKIILMDALPQIFVGLRLALSQSLIVTIVSEMFIGTEFGLGQRVFDSYLTNSVTSLYAFLMVLGLFGYFVNKLLLKLERRAVFWVFR